MKNIFKKGFTLIDLLLAIGLMITVFSFTTVNLLNLQNKPLLDAHTQKLFADLKSQQNKAIAGDSGDGIASLEWGIYIEPHKYTLFKGSEYSPSDPNNFSVELDSNTTLTTTFANSTVVFNEISGEILNYTTSADTITVTNNTSGESRTIRLNALGAAAIN